MALRWLTSTFFVTALMKTARSIDLSRGDPQGPLFIVEPPHHVDFSNSTGIRLECSAHGNPTPTIRWVLVDLSEVTDVERVRKRLDNGTLMFPPFQAEDYRQDVHAAIYRCMAFNPLGTIVSREVRLRAVVKQVYEVQVYDEYVIRGNTAVLKCQIPSFVIDYVVVTSWVRDMAFNIHTAIETGGQYMMMPTGELHVRDVTQTDGYKSYRCKTTHRLTGETRLSSTYGRLIVTDPRGSVQPRITDSKQSVSARQGERVALPCAAQGFPLPSYSWYVKTSKNQLIPLSLTENMRQISGTLIITTAHVSDSATYVCVVNNSVGSERVETTLTINVPVSGYVRPQKQVVDIGRPANFTCIISGVPIRMVSWTKDGRPLVTNDRVKLLTRDYLQINGIRREDRGMYQCHVRNDIEYVQATAELRLGDASPEIVTTFREQTVQPGSSVSLQCVVIGNPPPQISWTLHDSPLPIEGGFSSGTVINMKGEVVGSLNISHVRTEDGGEYRCTARNRAGSVDYAARLNVYGRPYIRPMPRLSIVDGDVMTIKCPVSGYPIESITWEKDGMTLPVNHRQDVHKNGTLTIVNVQRLTDSGRYSCVARNPQGHTARRDLEVIVMVPPQWVVEPQDASVLVGHRLQIECAASGFPNPTIAWKKAVGNSPGKYQELPYGLNGIEQLSNGTLAMIQAGEADRGYYLCQATNGIGAGLSKVIFINVHIPSRFDVKTRNQTVIRSKTAILSCEAKGDTPTVITWTVNHQQISPTNPRYKIKELPQENGMVSELTIPQAERDDIAAYICQASNAFGKDETTIHLFVQEVPDAPRNLRVVDQGKRSMQVTWSEPYSGYSLISRYVLQYKRNTDSWQGDVQNATTSGSVTTYTITNLAPASVYNIRVLAENEVGGSRPSEVITMTTAEEAPAGPPQKVKVDSVDSNTLKVTWKPPRKDLWNGHIQGYYVGYKVYESSSDPYVFNTVEARDGSEEEHHLHLTNLRKYTRYVIIVQSFNRMGAGPKSDEVIALTLEDVPDKPPEEVKCSTVSAQSLHVEWEAPPSAAVNGVLQGYKVLYSPSEDWNDDVVTETKITTAFKTTLHGLEKNTNYSIQVLAFTRMGDGVKSDPVFCRTNEDVPEAPADIKGALMSPDAIIVVWKPPNKPNGKILKYTVYIRSVQDSKEETVKYTIFSNQQLFYEATNLKSGKRFDFWVTASTNIGEGQSTKVVSYTTGSKIPARIVSFGDHLIYPWKTNIQMPCRAVGAPAPDREWRTRNHVIQANDKINLHANGSLELQHILSNDAGSYSCRVNNIYGTDIIVYNLSVLAPPATPSLTLSATSLTSIQVKWKQGSDGGSSIRVYSLNYKRDYGEWEEIGIEPSRDVFTMENLWCGSRYQLYLTAINKIGASEPSPVISTKTKGSAPEFPPAHKLLQENSTHIALNLDSWTSGGCPILYFVVEYKLTTHKEWTLVSNNIKPQQERVTILGLKPGTPYHLRVTAHNSAGSTIGEYDFVTLTLHGGTIPPMLASDQKEFPFAFDLKVIVSVTASVLIIISTLVLVCFCIRRQHHQDLQEKPGDIKPLPPTATFQVINQEGNPVHEKGSFTLLLGNTNDSVLRSYGSEMLKKDNHTGILQEDICPYATFRIPGCREQDHVSHTSAQYHTYTSRNSVSECSSRAQQSPMYSKVQKQLLQQHPSSTSVSQREEYVSPVSDSEFSDAEVAQYSESYAQLQDHPQNLPIMRLEQHVPDLLYHRPGSTSTETSPDTERQLYQRPGRTRNRHRHSKPNLVAGNRSSSPESPDEDGRFPYPHHLDPPLHFSDRHEMVLDQDHSPQVSLDGGWEILTDMKCKNYNRNEVDSEDATLLIRRFQTPPSAPLLHGHELSEDYTIAV